MQVTAVANIETLSNPLDKWEPSKQVPISSSLGVSIGFAL